MWKFPGHRPKEEIQCIALRARYLPQADMIESDEGLGQFSLSSR
jgi:hypothetical protein